MTSRISRRRFAAGAALTTALVPAAALPEAQAQQRQGAPLNESESAEVAARYTESMRKYGARLNEDQKQRIRTILTANERMMGRVREFPLENGDSPASTLKLAEGK